MVLRMSEETELTFKQLRELALAHHIADETNCHVRPHDRLQRRQ